MGRPSLYSPELVADICARLAEGRSLRSVCADDDMPDMATIFRWLGNPERTDFREQYARATETRAAAVFEELLEIADTPVEGVIEKFEAVGTPDPTAPGGIRRELVVTERRVEDMLGHRRLQVDTRKWWLSKVAPKKYGDKLEVDNKGELTINVGIKRFTPGEGEGG